MGPRLASYKELCDATDNFSEATKLGAGGQGQVWKAVYKGLDVVVKRYVA